MQTPSNETNIHDEITQRARELWQARGRPEGCDLEIWLEAERGILSAQKAQLSLAVRQPGPLVAVARSAKAPPTTPRATGRKAKGGIATARK